MFSFLNRKRPPKPIDVMNRALALRKVVGYAFLIPPKEMLDTLQQDWTAEQKNDLRHELESLQKDYWEQASSTKKFLTADELAFSKATHATVTSQQIMNFTWRLEAFHVLLWALKVVDKLHPYDIQTAGEILENWPPEYGNQLTPTMRPMSEIEEARELAELWHWRSRTRQLIENGETLRGSPEMKRAGINTYDDIVRMSAKAAREEKTDIGLIDEDFALLGKAYRDLSDEEYAQVTSITMERHFAFTWLCGYAPGNRWDETPTDT